METRSRKSFIRSLIHSFPGGQTRAATWGREINCAVGRPEPPTCCSSGRAGGQVAAAGRPRLGVPRSQARPAPSPGAQPLRPASSRCHRAGPHPGPLPMSFPFVFLCLCLSLSLFVSVPPEHAHTLTYRCAPHPTLTPGHTHPSCEARAACPPITCSPTLSQLPPPGSPHHRRPPSHAGARHLTVSQHPCVPHTVSYSATVTRPLKMSCTALTMSQMSRHPQCHLAQAQIHYLRVSKVQTEVRPVSHTVSQCVSITHIHCVRVSHWDMELLTRHLW